MLPIRQFRFRWRQSSAADFPFNLVVLFAVNALTLTGCGLTV